MTRETKLNLIFLAVILALLGPAGVLLFLSRLKPSIKPLTDPDPVPRTVAFIAPGPVPPGMTRVYPKNTAKWVDELMRQHGAGDIKLARDDHGRPMVSKERTFQLLGVRRQAKASTVLVLVWRDITTGSSTQWTLDADGSSHTPLAVQSETIEIPQLVQKELGANQILILPKHVQWIDMTFPALGDNRWTLHRHISDKKQDQIVFLPPFTRSLPQAN